MLASMSEQTPEQIKAASPEIEPADDYVEAAAVPELSPVELDPTEYGLAAQVPAVVEEA